jgi:hypothetical protein
MKRVWLDDVRPPPDDTWTWARTVEDVIALIDRGDVGDLSLDHEVGEGEREGREVCLWMAEHDTWPAATIAVHSANPVGVDYMCGVIERYGPLHRLGRARYRRRA